MRLLALDVDQTIAPANRPVAASTLALLREIEDLGVRLMLVSGKPACYLAGFARQLGLAAPLIAGEDGIVTMSTPDYPPRWQRVAAATDDVRFRLGACAAEARARFGDRIWLQPNAINVSIFWQDPADAPLILAFAHAFAEASEATRLRVYEHVDAVEVTVPDVDKGVALASVMAELGLTADEVVAVGDSSNDVPMFRVAGMSVGVGFAEADVVFPDVDAALRWLIERMGGGR